MKQADDSRIEFVEELDVDVVLEHDVGQARVDGDASLLADDADAEHVLQYTADDAGD